MIRDIDVYVPMRDGVKLCVDIYRPDTTEKLPALLAFAIYNKDFQGPDVAEDAAAAAGLDAAVDRAARGRRHAFPRVARLRPRDRLAARRRQVGRRRLAAMGQLRPDRVDRGAALVRRQCRHGRHLRLRRRAVPCRQAAAAASEGDLPVRSARRLRHARQLPRGISRRRAAPVPLSGRPLLGDAPAPRRARRAARAEGNAIGARRWPIPTTGCIRTSSTCWRRRGSTCRRSSTCSIDPYEKAGGTEHAEAELAEDQGAVLHRLRLVRLHVQDPSQRRAELFRRGRCAEEADVHRTGASGAAVPLVPPRDAEVVRPLAARHRHRHHARAAGEVLGDGREPMAQRRRLAAAGDAVDQALSQQLGAADAPSRSRRRASTSSCRPTRSCRCRRRRPRRCRSCAT